MALKVIGAGLGRTGTNSLKVALERLLGGPCYHMYELARRMQDMDYWERAVRGEAVDWSGFVDGYVAAVDWPACAFWRELAQAHGDALILLSTRESPEIWFDSVRSTIAQVLTRTAGADEPDTARRRAMIRDMLTGTFTADWQDRDAAIAAYERHNGEVRRLVPAERLIDWQPSDGWQPICRALDMAEPSEPFPHLNTTAEFRAGQSPANGQD